MPDLGASLRGRLWPTRRLYEWRHEQLVHEVSQLRRLVEQLTAEQRVRLDAVEAAQESLNAVAAELRTRLRRTQALAARTYEAQQGWPALLAQARADPDYELAYSEPEPLISIAVSTYHSPDTLCRRALASVRAQTHRNWEAIVVGDHCTDDTAARVRALGDDRISFHNLPVRENDPDDPWERWAVKGSVPRATGVGLARGRWIAPLSHDDAWDPDHLAALLAAARQSRAEAVYSAMRIVPSADPERAPTGSCGAWPPQIGAFNWQSAMFHGGLRFLRYDRNCALASEPNDWNLARRAWEAGVRFHYLARETSTLYVHPSHEQIYAELAAAGLPPHAVAFP